MNALLRNRALRLGTQLKGVRNMSGHSMEDAIAETEKWKKISYVFLPFVVISGIYIMADHFRHHHHWIQVKYPYIQKRDKPMPWALAGGKDVGLFDYGEKDFGDKGH